MEKLKSTLPNMLLSLAGVCLIAGAALAAVHQFTAEPIRESKAAALQNAIRKVTPEFDNTPTEEMYKCATYEGDSLTIFPAKKGGTLVGAAVESTTKKGFSGEIKVIVGFDAQGKLLNYSVLQHAETPGLGSKMEQWFRTDKNRQNVLGKELSAGALKVTKDGGNIDAITAATISSRAFLDAINRAYSAYKNSPWPEGMTGASVQTGDDETQTEGNAAPRAGENGTSAQPGANGNTETPAAGESDEKKGGNHE